MAGDTALTVHELTLNEQSSAAPALVEVSTSTGDYTIDVDGKDGSKLILQVSKAGADTGNTITLKAGSEFSAVGLGDVTVIATDSSFVGPFETARFKSTDGKIHIKGDTDGSTSELSVRAILLP